MKPLVSVVIPTYNRARTITRAVDSALGQNVPVEVIVVDDGSKDDTAEVLRPYGDRIVLLRQANSGVAGARTAGVRRATCDFIAFLDSDDEWLPGKLEKQLAILNANPEVALTSAAAEFVDAQGKVISRGHVRHSGMVVDELLCDNFIVTSSVLVRRSALPDGELFRKEVEPVEDWELWLRVAARHPMIVTSDVLLRYHALADSLTRQLSLDAYQRLFDAVIARGESDPALRDVVQRNRRAMLAFMHVCTAIQHYNAGLEMSARKHVLRALVKSPSRVAWNTALPILLLPRALRDPIRRLVRVALKR